MKKAAFFVEGQTEMLFVTELLKEIAGHNNIVTVQHQRRGGGLQTVNLAGDGKRYFALVCDCGADSAVASAINEEHGRLAQSGYSVVIGLRDLYPKGHADLATLKARLAGVLPTAPPAVHITIAVTEIEAWFVQEDSHFPRIKPACTRAAIEIATAFDIASDNAETLRSPTSFLKTAYALGRTTYNKKRRTVVRTIAALDFSNLYLSKRSMLASFDEFVGHIEAFLS